MIKIFSFLKRIYEYVYYKLKLYFNFAIEMHITDHCNLNCAGCYHFSPLSEENYLTIDSFIKDLRQLNKLLRSNLKELYLMGGEPLLHPNLIDFITNARNISKKIKIYLVTNGILLENQPKSFFDACKNCDISIAISLYPIQINYEGILKKLDKHNIKYEIHGDYRNRKMWKKFEIDPSGKQKRKESSRFCGSGHAYHQLHNGKLFMCVPPAYVSKLNNRFNFSINVSKKDYIDIHTLKTPLKIFLKTNNSIPFCKYCVTKKQKNINWKKSQLTSDEWIMQEEI